MAQAVVLLMGQLHQVGSVACGEHGVSHRFWFAPGTVDVGQQVQRGGRSQRDASCILHTHDTSGVRIDHQAHGLARQLVGHFKALTQVGHRGVLPHKARDAVKKQCVELDCLGAQGTDSG